MTIWYGLGTVEATNGSTTITGALTAWLAMAKPGDEIYFDADARGYEVASIASNTSMEISPAYAGTTGSGKAYRLKPIGPGWNSVTELSTSVAELLTLVGNEITNGIGVPSNDEGNNGDTYIRTDVPSIYAKESGAWVLKAQLSGPQGDPGPSYQATSTSSVAIGTGSKSFTLVEPGRGYTVGQRLRVTSSASTSNYMEGLVTSYSSPTLVINVDRVGGSGTIASWNINITGDPGPANSLAIGSVTAGSPGSAASASLTGTAPSQTLNLVLPRGATGPANSLSIGTVEQGSAAASITGDAPTQTLNLVLPKGDAATIEVGDVTTVDPGDPATVTNSGTSAEAVFDFEIPRGAPGVSVTHRGDYDSGTEYAFNDQVLESGSTWQYVHAEPSSGNAPPTLPTTANDHWQLSSRRGVDGVGAVNTVNSEAPDIDGDVTISAVNIAVPHTPVNFEPEGASINDFIAAIDARLGDAADVGVIEWTTVASASTVDLSVVTTEGVVITGTTTITTLTMAPNSRKTIRFTGALVLTHHATANILPGGASVTTIAGEIATAVADGDGNIRWVSFPPRWRPATDAVPGAVELATTAEATTGTDTTRAVTPAGVLGALRNNLLGTVSESSGVPTGAVIERGSNANGEYVRFADGTQICWQTGVTFNRQSNTLARFSWTFPAAFVDSVSGIACSRSNQGGDYTGDITIASVGGYSTPATGFSSLVFDFIRIDGSANWGSGGIANCRVLAIGRWF